MVSSDSRYNGVKQIQRNGKVILDTWERKRFNSDLYTYYMVVSGDTLDGIAAKFYNNPTLLWAIMDANPILQSELDLAVGMILNIPDREEVVSYVG